MTHDERRNQQFVIRRASLSETWAMLVNGESPHDFAPDPPPTRAQRILLFPARLGAWLWRPMPRNVIAWLLALGLAIGFLENSWYYKFSSSCDFAGQWLMGRMFYEQVAQHLYLVQEERKVLATAFSGQLLHDLDFQLLTKGHANQADVVVEGPLYPPTAGFFFWPVMILGPPAAHAVMVFIYTLLGFVIAWLLRVITHGRLRMGEAAAIVFLFPNTSIALVLGQNSMLTLAIIVAGWAVAARGWPLFGGLLWGLLAYKPVFAVALIGVPIVLFRWRMLVGMILGGAAFCLATLPFLLPPEHRWLWDYDKERQEWHWAFDAQRVRDAIAPWQRWLEVGRHAAHMYTYDRNWVWMSRDLTGLPRRGMWERDQFLRHVRHVLDLDAPEDEDFFFTVNAGDTAGWIGAILVAGVGVTTAGLCWLTLGRLRRRDRYPTTAYAAARKAFLLTGLTLTSFHFMHYDLQLFTLPFALLLADATRRRWWVVRPTFDLALALTLVTTMLLIGCLWLSAPYLEKALWRARTTPATAKTESTDGSQPATASTPASLPHATASAPMDFISPKADAAPEETAGATVLVRWVVLLFAGVLCGLFLGAWFLAGWLRSWQFLGVLGTLLIICTIDLGFFTQSMRIPFEIFVFLIQWLYAGYVMVRETWPRSTPLA